MLIPDLAIPASLLTRVEDTISKYRLFGGQRRIVVAFSGGKDSTFTACVLKELGYDVHLAAVDMGYSEGWPDRLNRLAQQMGLPLDLMPVRNRDFRNEMEPRNRESVEMRLRILESIPGQNANGVSPCTQCYNTKVTALSHCMQGTSQTWIAFGHHATDSIASLLKSALMYVDRRDHGNEKWDRCRFQALVGEVLSQLNSRAQIGSYVDRFVALVQNGWAGTDEAPVQRLLTDVPDLQIARPLFEVFEHEIQSFTASSALASEPSGCGHGALVETQTPREMIHYQILRSLALSDRGREWLQFFLQLVKSGLNDEGQVRFNVRNLRKELLGPEYRSGLGSDVKL